MKIRNTVLQMIFILSIIVSLNCTKSPINNPTNPNKTNPKPSKPLEKTPEEKTQKWYLFRMISPLYFTYALSDFLFCVMFTVTQIILIIFLLLPFKIIDGIQSTMISGLGFFYFLAHIPAKLLLIRKNYVNFIGLVVSFILSLIAMILSVNEKFSNLFLSIGGGYAIVVIILGILGFKNYFVYIFFFLVATFLVIKVKRFNPLLHFGLTKGLVVGFGICINLNIILRSDMFIGVYENNSNFFVRTLKTVPFLVAFPVIFMITFYKFDVRRFLMKK